VRDGDSLITMLSYAIKRLLRAVVILLGVATFVFIVIHVIPGNPIIRMLGPDATQAQMDEMARDLGLDQPVYVQLIKWLENALKGDFGRSLFTGQPVIQEVTQRLKASIELIAVGGLIGIPIGLLFGVVAGTKPNSLIDRLISAIAVLTMSLPSFMLSILLIYIFAVKLGWFPSFGRGSIQHLVLPGCAVAVWFIGIIARLTRYNMIEIMSLDYIRTARSKGLTECVVILVHAIRNTLIPVVTFIGITFGRLFGAAVGIEVVFAWPGLSRLLVDSILVRDYPVVQASLLMLGAIFVVINLLVDMSYPIFDPRIRL
jgi:peptide/nickel transport system permease protein